MSSDHSALTARAPTDPAVLLDVVDGVGTITLNRPENRNALSAELVEGLESQLDAALADPAVHVIVLTGRGTVFCAGADLKERRTVSTGTDGDDLPAFVRVFEKIQASPKVVVGRLQGPALAGGLGLASVCDLTIAVDTAMFGFTEIRLGLTPAIISVVCLPKLSVADAAELFLTGERISAARAVEVGLINRAVPADQLDVALGELLSKLRLGGPNALGFTKALLRRVPQIQGQRVAFVEMAALSASLFASEEGIEGMTAFAQKRPPRWAVPTA